MSSISLSLLESLTEDSILPMSHEDHFPDKEIKARIERLREHHNKCADHYNRAAEEQNTLEKKHTLLLQQVKLSDKLLSDTMQTWDPEALRSSVDLSEVDSEVSTERVPMSTSPKANTNYAAMEQYFTSVSSGTSPISTDNVFLSDTMQTWDPEALGSSVDLSEVDSEVSTERVPMSTSPKANTNYAAMEQYFTSVSSGTSPISTDNVFLSDTMQTWDPEALGSSVDLSEVDSEVSTERVPMSTSPKANTNYAAMEQYFTSVSSGTSPISTDNVFTKTTNEQAGTSAVAGNVGLIPDLKRTDSVFLTKKMLGYGSDDSVSSIDQSEDEYIPESESSSSAETDTGLLNKAHGKSIKKCRSTPRSTVTENSTSGNDFLCPLNITTEDSDTELQCQQGKSIKKCTSTPRSTVTESSPSNGDSVSVMNVLKKKDGSRLYSKRHFCLFCGKAFAKIARHMEHVHSKEMEVASALRFSKNSKERRILLDHLRKRGDRGHNIQVLREGKGVMVPCKQTTNTNVNPQDFMHCASCQGLFKRKFLWKHMARCRLAQKCAHFKPGKTRIQALCANAQPVPEGISNKFWKQLNSMTQDEVAHTIKQDECIIKLGEQMYNKMGHDPTKHEYIRQKMREVGRLLVTARKVSPLKTMVDFFLPSNFPYVVHTVKNVAGFNEESNSYKTPSLALKLGHSLQKIASIVECEAMIVGDQKTVQNVQNFKQIYRTRWNEVISSSALKTLTEAKWNAPQLLPFADDVKKMHIHLQEKQNEFFKHLSKEPSPKNWTNLAKVTLAQIILFNRRREGEVSKMLLETFISRDTSCLHEDVAEALSDVEKRLCHHFERVEIRGKRGRKVPVLLTPDMLLSLELLLQERTSCQVLEDNVYVFARPGAESHIRGSDCIRYFAKECGANHPETLSSTKLRKHVSTLSRVLNLNDTEMDQLADFLGHDIRIHRKYYRLPEGTLQLAKISKILMALEQGRLSEFKGKNLDQIDIDPSESVLVASELSDSEEEASLTEPAFKQPCEAQSSGPSKPAKTKESLEAKKIENEDLHGPAKSKKRKWTTEEVQAVETSMMMFITAGRTPGKAQCLACIKAAPQALKERDWTAVKFFVKNRITAYQREHKK